MNRQRMETDLIVLQSKWASDWVRNDENIKWIDLIFIDFISIQAFE